MIWALTTRVDAARDVTIVDNTPIDYLDFASPVVGTRVEDGHRRDEQVAGRDRAHVGRPIAMDARCGSASTSCGRSWGCRRTSQLKTGGRNEMAEADDKKAKDLALLVYILQAVGFVIGLTWIVGVIINYVKRDDVRGTWVESHFDWQIKTFWIALAGSDRRRAHRVDHDRLRRSSSPSRSGCIYRVVKGWLALNDGKPLGTGFI